MMFDGDKICTLFEIIRWSKSFSLGAKRVTRKILDNFTVFYFEKWIFCSVIELRKLKVKLGLYDLNL